MCSRHTHLKRIVSITQVAVKLALFRQRSAVIGSCSEFGTNSDPNPACLRGNAFRPVLPELANPNRHPEFFVCHGSPPGSPAADRHAVEFVAAVVHLKQSPSRALLAVEHDLVSTFLRVREDKFEADY